MEIRGVPLSLAHKFEMSALSKMSSEMIKASIVNIKRAREDFVLCLHHQFPPREGQPLYEWMQEGERYKNGYHLEANNFETHPTSRKVVLSMTAVFILRAIMYSHNLPLETVIMLWSCFHALILRTPIRNKDFISSSALWNRVQQLHYINGALGNEQLEG